MHYLFRDKKSGVFYFRYQIPTSYRSLFENRSVIKRSLKTYDKVVARMKALRIELEIREKMNKQEETIEAYLIAKKTLLHTAIIKYLDLSQSPAIFEFISKFTGGLTHHLNAQDKAEFERMILEHVDFNSAQLSAIYNPSYGSPPEQATAFMKLKTSDITSLTFAQSMQLKSQLTRLFTLAKNVREVLESGEHEKVPKLLNKFQLYLDNEHKEEQLSSGKTIERTRSLPVERVNFAKMLETYHAEKTIKGTKNLESIISNIKAVHEVVNKKDMSQIDRKDALKAVELIKQYPMNAKKHFGSKISALEVIKKNKKKKLAVISTQTANRYIERTSSFYKWAKQQNTIQYNPFEGLAGSKNRGVNEEERKAPFNRDDLRFIFSHNVFKTGKVGKSTKERKPLNYQYWLPLLALFTACRPNELCQLHKSDIVQKDGVWCIDNNLRHETKSLKNSSANRLVPVHSTLIKMGFLNFVDSIEDGKRLFEELNYNAEDGYYKSVANWFSRSISSKTNFKEEKKTFYSFRHTFIDEFKQRGDYDNILASMTAHKHGSVTFDTYGGRVKPTVMKEKIELINFDDVLENVSMPWAEKAPTCG